ncbi:MAG: NAD-dependent epimerase/dehydratase family protein [Thermoplasmata archaeon]|nr:NAD-dependent epimerase/dehydratase family protein [Thermoplasmata archaeon]
MKALVTGGAGFLGPHLVDRLLADGWEVVVIDRMDMGDRNIREHLEAGRISLHRMVLKDFDATRPLFGDVDTVFHLLPTPT